MFIVHMRAFRNISRFFKRFVFNKTDVQLKLKLNSCDDSRTLTS